MRVVDEHDTACAIWHAFQASGRAGAFRNHAHHVAQGNAAAGQYTDGGEQVLHVVRPDQGALHFRQRIIERRGRAELEAHAAQVAAHPLRKQSRAGSSTNGEPERERQLAS